MSLVVCVPPKRKKFYIRGTVRVGNQFRDVYETTGIGIHTPQGRKLAEQVRFQLETRIRTELIDGAGAVVTWKEAVTEYAKKRKSDRLSIDPSLGDEPDKQIEYVLKWTEWFDSLGKLEQPLQKIKQADLDQYFEFHHDSKRNLLSTRKREANVYLAVMNFAQQEWKIGAFPRPKIAKVKSRSKAVNKWLYVEEVSLFIRLAPVHLSDYVAGVFATGCRGGPILHLPRHRPVPGRNRGAGLIMDKGKEQFYFGLSKSGHEDTRILPDWYADRLRRYLANRKDEHDALFLTDRGVPYAKLKRQSGFQVKTAWRNLRERVAQVILRLARLKLHQAKMLHGSQREEMISKAQELEGRAEVVRSVTPHWGRHNLASHAFIKGMDTEKVRRLGNWQTDAMVRRYQHLKPDFGKELANVVEFPKTQGTSSRKTKSRVSSKKAD